MVSEHKDAIALFEKEPPTAQTKTSKHQQQRHFKRLEHILIMQRGVKKEGHKI